jgi:hypothetical protein
MIDQSRMAAYWAQTALNQAQEKPKRTGEGEGAMIDQSQIKAIIARPCNAAPYVRVWIFPMRGQHHSQDDEDLPPPHYYEVEMPDGLEGTALSPSHEWQAGFLAGIQTKDEHYLQSPGSSEETPRGSRTARTLGRLVSKVLKLVRFQGVLRLGRFSSYTLTPAGCFGAPTVGSRPESGKPAP